jgi:hypothetical protein
MTPPETLSTTIKPPAFPICVDNALETAAGVVRVPSVLCAAFASSAVATGNVISMLTDAEVMVMVEPGGVLVKPATRAAASRSTCCSARS